MSAGEGLHLHIAAVALDKAIPQHTRVVERALLQIVPAPVPLTPPAWRCRMLRCPGWRRVCARMQPVTPGPMVDSRANAPCGTAGRAHELLLFLPPRQVRLAPAPVLVAPLAVLRAPDAVF